MKPSHRLRCFLAALGSATLGVSSASAATYYWDDNGATAAFGTAGASTGTWAAPTTGPTAGWSLSSAGTDAFSGYTTAAGDVLNFGDATNGLAAGTITVSGTVTSGQGATGITFGSASGNIVISGGIIDLGSTTTITSNNTKNTIQSTLTGTTLVTAGTGALELTGANTYTGTTQVDAGTLILSGSNNSSGATSVFNGSILQLNSSSNGGLASGTLSLSSGSGGTLQAINADRSITNLIQLGGGPGVVSGNYSITTSNSLRVFNGSRTLTNNLASGKSLKVLNLAANAASNRNLTLDGSGKTIVTGTSSFGGGTNTVAVNGGVFILNGALTTGGVSVGASGTLGGTGTINSSTAISGRYSPGSDVATVGSQSITGTLTFNTGSIFNWDVTNDTTFDAVTGLSALAKDAGTGGLFNVVTADITSAFWNVDQSFTNVFNTGDMASVFSAFQLNGTDLTGGLVSGEGTFTFSGSGVNWTVIPEPGSALLGGLGVLLLLRRRRN